ncbi:MAG: type II toxin-antitoxin system death-on-curing family toxin [Cytophagales bacterium]|nr:type II toxin-antitoxin system death-on-curing family toxin [Cytophagales bacterium]
MSATQVWTWLNHDVMLAVHDEQLDEHGGLSGIRDMGLFASAVERPKNLATDESADESPDVADLAASYGSGLANNHPFNDGNKRTAYVAMELFLVLNGYQLTSSDADSVLMMLGVASGDIAKTQFAQWIRHNMKRRI